MKLRPGQAVRVILIAQEGMQGIATGFLRGSDNLPDGCIVWHGVQERKDNQVLAYITNHSKENLELRANVLIATWEADIDEDIATGDRLVRHAEEARGSPKAMSILTLTEAGDDWEWADEHLYLDVSRTPVGEPDPPVEATLETLKEALREKIQQLGDRLLHGDNTPDACEERRRDLDQLKRINARIKQQQRHCSNINRTSTRPTAGQRVRTLDL